MINYPRQALSWLADLIFPYRCVICGKFLDQEYLCSACLNQLPIQKHYECVGCQGPTPLGKTCTFCREENYLDQLFVVSNFDNPDLAKVIKTMKYRFLTQLIKPLGILATRYLNHIAKRDHFSIVAGNPFLVPVPLHKTRENWRGFNQAELIAVNLAQQYHLESLNLISRTSRGTPQAELEDRPERLSNARGLYVVSDPAKIKSRPIILIDDVCTTGATLNECARALKTAGANQVAALVIARGS